MAKDSNPIVPSKDSLTYDKYLKVSELINLQELHSDPEQHDEMLFIIIHQVYELWFKLILHEVNHAIKNIGNDQVLPYQRTLNRIAKIQDVLNHQVDILETMTTTDFNKFRDHLNPASGFQSYQFRLIEYLLGAKNKSYLKFYRSQPDQYKILEEALSQPSLYDHFLAYLKRSGYQIPSDMINRDKTIHHDPDRRLMEVFLDIYKNAPKHYAIYNTLEAMIDLDEKLRLWRYRHIAMVERMIGNRTGTGGSTGVEYLSTTLNLKLFPEIWDVRSYLGS